MGKSEVKINTKGVLHEFIGVTLLVYVGCGVAMVYPGTAGDRTISIAFAFGMAIMTLVYATAHTSGGQLNWAVTLGLMVEGSLKPEQACANMVSQLLGAILGATLLLATLPEGQRGGLGSNGVVDGYSKGQAFTGEMIMTFLLVFVIFQTAIDGRAITGSDDKARPVAAPLAIGFAVFLAHLFLIPITGCSINPPRSFGPALVATIDGEKKLFDDFWIFFLAPIVGGVLAGLLHKFTRVDAEAESSSSV